MSRSLLSIEIFFNFLLELTATKSCCVDVGPSILILGQVAIVTNKLQDIVKFVSGKTSQSDVAITFPRMLCDGFSILEIFLWSVSYFGYRSTCLKKNKEKAHRLQNITMY